MPDSTGPCARIPVVVLALAALAGGCDTTNDQAARETPPPHVEHMTLPPHKVWRVVSVQPYEGLADIELVRVDWPTAQDPRLAFALTRENLQVGDPICLDHVVEIDTLWAHPVPDGGCEARASTATP